jgi:hypothetical protein
MHTMQAQLQEIQEKLRSFETRLSNKQDPPQKLAFEASAGQTPSNSS